MGFVFIIEVWGLVIVPFGNQNIYMVIQDLQNHIRRLDVVWLLRM